MGTIILLDNLHSTTSTFYAKNCNLLNLASFQFIDDVHLIKQK